MTYLEPSSKDIKWMKLCIEGAKIFSTCSKKQYMAIIVDKYGVVNATGYNGTPSGFTHCNDGGCPRFLNDVPSGTPYDYGEGLCYSNHAEQNCLSVSDPYKRQGGTLYVNGWPCFNCAKLIVNSGCDRIVYLKEDFERVGVEVTLELFKQGKITIIGVPREFIL